MELKKPIPGDQIIGLSAIVLFLFSFVHWLDTTVTVKLGGSTLSVSAGSAWDFTLTTIAVLLGLVLLGYVILRVVGVDLPTRVGSVTLGQIVVGIAGTACLLVLIKLIAGGSASAIASGPKFTVTKSRKFGIYVGLLSTAGLFVGAMLSFQAEQLGAT